MGVLCWGAQRRVLGASTVPVGFRRGQDQWPGRLIRGPQQTLSDGRSSGGAPGTLPGAPGWAVPRL